MKKINLLVGLIVSNFCIAQNEWNSINNSTASMFRNGNVAIGTGATTTLPFAVRASAAGAATKIAFGHTTMQNTYVSEESVLEISGKAVLEPTMAKAVLSLNSEVNSDRSIFNLTANQNEVSLTTTMSSGAAAVPMKFYTNSGSAVVERMTIRPDGKIGIGIPPASYPGTYNLYVTGGILTEKIKVALTSSSTGWSDFVFEPDYKLLTLEETEAFIKKNKHLPDIPSAKEVETDGIDVATMDAKLLQKIEELTLYMIEFKKENNNQKKMIEDQQLESENLKKAIELLKKENEDLKLKIK